MVVAAVAANRALPNSEHCIYAGFTRRIGALDYMQHIISNLIIFVCVKISSIVTLIIFCKKVLLFLEISLEDGVKC